MRIFRVLSLLLLFGVAAVTAANKPWNVELAYIEACSCDLFCTCYFLGHASHQGTGDRHTCNFNMATKVTRGRYGEIDLTGLKFWLSGDLGPNWAHGRGNWLVVTFEPATTKAQRDALLVVLTKIYPLQWNSLQFDESNIVWEMSRDGKKAHGKLSNGKGEVTLTRFAGSDPKKPTEIQNLHYLAADWNSPFALYFSDHYYNGFGKSYKLERANGFTITVKASGK